MRGSIRATARKVVGVTGWNPGWWKMPRRKP